MKIKYIIIKLHVCELYKHKSFYTNVLSITYERF